MSTSTAAAPPATSGADGPEPESVSEATGVLSAAVVPVFGETGVAAAVRCARAATLGEAPSAGVALGRGFAPAVAAPSFCAVLPAAFFAVNTTSEHE